MSIEAALVKPVVDALMALLRKGGDVQLQRNAQAAVREAIRELLLANPDENKAAARIAIAKAAGILSEDVVLAEDMLARHRSTKARTRGKAATGRKRRNPSPLEASPNKSATKKAAPPAKSAKKTAPGNGPAKKAATRTARKTARATSRRPRGEDTD